MKTPLVLFTTLLSLAVTSSTRADWKISLAPGTGMACEDVLLSDITQLHYTRTVSLPAPTVTLTGEFILWNVKETLASITLKIDLDGLSSTDDTTEMSFAMMTNPKFLAPFPSPIIGIIAPQRTTTNVSLSNVTNFVDVPNPDPLPPSRLTIPVPPVELDTLKGYFNLPTSFTEGGGYVLAGPLPSSDLSVHIPGTIKIATLVAMYPNAKVLTIELDEPKIGLSRYRSNGTAEDTPYYTSKLIVSGKQGSIATLLKYASPSNLDEDGDNVRADIDQNDQSDMRAQVDVNGEEAGETSVENGVDEDGLTIQDDVNTLSTNAKNHGQYVSNIQKLTRDLLSSGAITKEQRSEMNSVASKSKIGRKK